MGLAALACAGGAGNTPRPEPEAPAPDPAAALERIRPGDAPAHVHALFAAERLALPRPPERLFPLPRRRLTWAGPDGVRVAVEFYVVAAWAAEGCPDVQYRDEPVVFLDGRVAAVGWRDVEAGWREWGGTLGALRDVQARYRCTAGNS